MPKNLQMDANAIVQKQKNAVELSIIQDIHEIRGAKVILDFDLAARYQVETRRLKEAVRRNIKRFEGDDFMFEITRDEYNSLRSQFATLEVGGRGKYSKYQPFAFTELGVAMLSSVLNSEKAIDINREIMRAFVAIRQYVLNYAELKYELYDFIRETNISLDKTNTRLDNNDIKVDEVFKMLTKLLDHKRKLKKPNKILGFRANANKKEDEHSKQSNQ